MKNYLSLLLALALAGCCIVDKQPQNLRPIPSVSSVQQGPPLPPMPVAKRMLLAKALPKLAPTGAVFYDPFDSGANTQWTFYQGTHLFTNGILKLSVAQNAGQYAYVRTNWLNVSVQADIRMLPNSWGAAVGLRYNPTNGANYQAWIYQSGRLTIEKYNDWYVTWKEIAGTTIANPGTNVHNVRLSMTNNVLTAYLDGVQTLKVTDSSAPLMNRGGVDLGVWGGNAAMSAEFDNVIVYDLDVAPVTSNTPPQLVSGLTNVIGLQGNNITLAVSATGYPLSYYWKTPNGIIKAGTNTYTITNAQYASKGTYTAYVSNNLAQISSAAYIAVGTTNILTNCVTAGTNASVTLAWCPSPSNGIGGYNIYYGSGMSPTGWVASVYLNTNCPGVLISSGTNWFRAYTNRVDAGTNLSTSVSNLVRGSTYFFAATAYDTNALESDFSEEVRYTVPTPTNSPYTFSVTLAKLNNKSVLQTKVCPYSLMTVWSTTNLVSPWKMLTTNSPADAYGNYFYTDLTPSALMQFYRIQLQ